MDTYTKQVKENKINGKDINGLLESGEITQADSHKLKGMLNDQAREDVKLLREVVVSLTKLVERLEKNHIDHLRRDVDNLLKDSGLERC